MGLSQTELGRLLGMAPSGAARLEAGEHISDSGRAEPGGSGLRGQLRTHVGAAGTAYLVGRRELRTRRDRRRLRFSPQWAACEPAERWILGSYEQRFP